MFLDLLFRPRAYMLGYLFPISEALSGYTLQ